MSEIEVPKWGLNTSVILSANTTGGEVVLSQYTSVGPRIDRISRGSAGEHFELSGMLRFSLLVEIEW